LNPFSAAVAPLPVAVFWYLVLLLCVHLAADTPDALQVEDIWPWAIFFAAAVSMALSVFCILLTDFLNAFGLLRRRNLAWACGLVALLSGLVIVSASVGLSRAETAYLFVSWTCAAAISLCAVFWLWWRLALPATRDLGRESSSGVKLVTKR